jgi:hypothetical protein
VGIPAQFAAIFQSYVFTGQFAVSLLFFFRISLEEPLTLLIFLRPVCQDSVVLLQNFNGRTIADFFCLASFADIHSLLRIHWDEPAPPTKIMSSSNIKLPPCQRLFVWGKGMGPLFSIKQLLDKGKCCQACVVNSPTRNHEHVNMCLRSC